MSGLVAAIYVRVSTVAQSGPDKSSLDRQLDECRILATRQGYDVPDQLVFRDSASGKREDRPSFQAMLAAAKRGELSRVFTWSVDRFGRSLQLSVNAVCALRDLGVGVETCKEGDLADTIRLGVLSAIAAREIERILERTLPARRAKREAGLFVDGREPYGYIRRADRSLEKCTVEGPIVRRIFRDCADGMGGTQISRRLNAEGAPPPEARVRMPDDRVRRIRVGHMEAEGGVGAFSRWVEKEGATVDGMPQWSTTSILNILKNTASYGFLGTSSDSAIPLMIHGGSIITRAEFDAAQDSKALRRKVGRRPLVPWLLTGLMVCGTCGASYGHKAAKSNSYHGYKCAARMAGKSCTSPGISMRVADSIVVKEVRKFLLDRLGGREEIRTNVLAEALRDRAEVEKQIAALIEELADADRQWSEAQGRAETLAIAGADMSALPAVLRKVNDARDRRKTIAGVLTAAMDRRGLLDAGLQVSSSELDRVVTRIADALRLVEGVGESRENMTDVIFVLKALVNRVVVRHNKTLLVEFKDDSASLYRVFADMLRASVEGHRADLGHSAMLEGTL